MRSRKSLFGVLVLVLALVGALLAAASAAPASTAAPAADGTSRFTGLDTFCKAAASPPTKAPKAIDDGITDKEISVTNVRLDTEIIKKIGFAYDYGDAVDQVNTFVGLINDECGGIDGRKIVVHDILQPVPGLSGDPQLQAQESCTKIVKDFNSIAAFSNTGIGDPLAQCVTGPNPVMYIGTYDFSEQDFKQSHGRLFSFNHSPTDILTYAARALAPKLKGKRVAVVTDDTAPDPEIVQEGLIKALKKAGVDATLDVLPCGDDPACASGIIPAVQRLKADGAKVVFPLLSALALPAYLNEMVTQGFKPGDVQFYNTSFQAQDSELVASHIADNGSKEAAALYDGATIISGGLEGDWRLPGYQPDKFNQMCNDAYIANSKVVTEPYDPTIDDSNRIYSVVAGHCAMVRLLARGIEAAGPNPTRAAIAKAIGRIGALETGAGTPATLKPGKPTAPDAIARLKFRFPCPKPVTNDANVCMVPTPPDFLPIPK